MTPLNGPDDKMHVFLQEVLSHISEYEIDKQKIAFICEAYKSVAKDPMFENNENKAMLDKEPMYKAMSNTMAISFRSDVIYLSKKFSTAS